MDEDAALFRALSDPTRLKLVVMLANAGETCVCRLTEALETSESNVSRHLRILRAQGVVKARRQGTWMHYSLVPNEEGPFRHLGEYLTLELPRKPGVALMLKRLEQSMCGTREVS